MKLHVGWSSAFMAIAVLIPVCQANAADLDRGFGDIAVEGLPCESPEVRAFPRVWLGHFTGGYSHHLGEGQQIVLDWRDEKLCFPDRVSCRGHNAEMRRDFRRPEGYFTCLSIR